MQKKLVRAITVLTSMFVALGLLTATPAALAYGIEQWQTGFAGTCLAPPCAFSAGGPGNFGFWGWCTFGGSSGSSAVGTTGSTADCQITFYFSGNPVVPVHASFDISGWNINTGSLFLPPGVPGFFLTSGTITFTGPLAALVGIPTGVPIPLTVLCPAGPTPGSLCDTGIPAIPGHFGFNPFPGFEIQIQVTKLP